MCDLSILAQLELGNGLFLAAPGGDYERVWIRDNVYVAEGFEALGDWTTTRRVFRMPDERRTWIGFRCAYEARP